MAATTQRARRGQPAHDAAGLPALALSRPDQALRQAHQVLRARPDARNAAFAHQAAGIVLRDRGDLAAALTHLRSAVRAAGRAAERHVDADIRSTLGATLAMAGRTNAGLRELDLAVAGSRGNTMAQARLRRAHVLHLLGRHDDALADLRQALTVLRRNGNVLWQARALNNRCMVYLATGELGRADADATAAAALFDAIGQELESVDAFYNRATVSARRGDLPAALAGFEVADARYRALGVIEGELVLDRGWALLAAGLAAEAAESVRTALSQPTWQPVRRAEIMLFGARAALAANDIDSGLRWADGAARLFRTQQRPAWLARARLLGCLARFRRGERSAQLLRASTELAPQLARLRSDETALGYLTAGRLAMERGRTDLARELLGTAVGYRANPSMLASASGWLATALLADLDGRPRALFIACGRGLDALDEHRAVFGAAEVRATATGHGRELASLAVDCAIAIGSGRSVLKWTERWRATALADAAMQTAADPDLAQELAALREAALRASKDPAAEHVRKSSEEAIRGRRLQLAGASAAAVSALDIESLMSCLQDAQLVYLLESRAQLHALMIADGRVRRVRVGPLAEALREADFTRFALRRNAVGRPRPVSAERLQAALLGPVVRLLEDRPVVVVPPAVLHGAPWSMLPALACRPVSVAPSARMWLRSRQSDAPTVGTASLVLGPGLRNGRTEIEALAALHRDSTVLGKTASATGRACAEPVLAALEGVALAHIAAHGTFRADSPMFSSLELEDGPLFVHDLDRLSAPPGRVVLSACDSGVGAPVGDDELLGLVSALLRLGTRGVLASVVAVNDAAAVDFMLAVHRRLASGASLAQACLSARQQAGGDPLAVSTAGSFSAWGD